MDYESFEELKKQADKYTNVHQYYQSELAKQAEFVVSICEAIEKANDCALIENKQYHIAQGIKAICKFYETDIADMYGKLDEGQAPEIATKQ